METQGFAIYSTEIVFFFHRFDTDESGTINMSEFLIKLRVSGIHSLVFLNENIRIRFESILLIEF